MNIKTKKIYLELLWWIFTFVIVLAVLYPIYSTTPDYPYFKTNALFIIVFVTFGRYIFLLDQTPLYRLTKVKIAIVLASLVIVFYLYGALTGISSSFDASGMIPYTKHLSFDELDRMRSYISKEILFFGAGAFISSLILPVSLILSVGKLRRKEGIH